MIRHKTTHGFTLLETVIYIALFSILMTGVLVTIYQLLESGTHNRTAVGVQEEGTFVHRKLYWALAGATDVTTPNPQTLIITRPDLGGQSPLRITEEDGLMVISRGGAASIPLTSSEFTVSNTDMSIIPGTAGVPTSVRVSYEVHGTPFLFRTYLRY